MTEKTTPDEYKKLLFLSRQFYGFTKAASIMALILGAVTLMAEGLTASAAMVGSFLIIVAYFFFKFGETYEEILNNV